MPCQATTSLPFVVDNSGVVSLVGGDTGVVKLERVRDTGT